MKMISWNVNGIRACVGKNFMDFFKEADADIFVFRNQNAGRTASTGASGLLSILELCREKGYSGTAIFAKKEPLSVAYGIGIEEHDHEGRVITLEYDNFYMVTVYTPNSQNELARLDYRMKWEDDFREYLKQLEQTKPVVVCGDMNVAHTEIDLKIQRPIVRTPDLQMRKEKNSVPCLTVDLLIRFVF